MIEGLASGNGFFGAFNNIEPNEENGLLISYSHNPFKYHFTDEFCGFISGIDEENVTEEITLFPNPANQYFTYQGSEEIESIFPYDMYGKCIRQIGPTTKWLDISPFSEGVYFTIFLMKNNHMIQKNVVIAR